ncbi:uncharacterized protein V1518DRAFT_421309 [Limtongia smithiae]|uniref:uncharacterized protein n=1 Tax=Limtongia smithiae TaxID=1125753 RepID=UPI0034CD6FAD
MTPHMQRGMPLPVLARALRQATTEHQHAPALRTTRFHTAQFLRAQANTDTKPRSTGAKSSITATHNLSADFKGRREALLASPKEMYPVIRSDEKYMRIAEVRAAYDKFTMDELQALDEGEGRSVTVRGRITNIRVAGKNLVFIDLEQEESKIQAIYHLNSFQSLSWNVVDAEQFKKSWELLRRGDFISLSGTLTRTKTDELSVRARCAITLLSPCLHPLPVTLSDRTKSHHRTVDFIVNPSARNIIRARSYLIAQVREFLQARDYLEVQTPILSDVAGGANARPFVTHASVFGSVSSSDDSEKHAPSTVSLELRIAPELWLKRLLISGFDRVFEIGQVFRNEGIDHTHNPEFTTCEFYQAFASIDDLVELTEQMLSEIVAKARVVFPAVDEHLVRTGLDFSRPFERIEFIPTLEEYLGVMFPDYVLQSNTEEDRTDADKAHEFLHRLFKERHIPLPEVVTVPRMFDKLADHFIGPHLAAAKKPTFLINFPEVLSPLAKSAPSAGKPYNIARRFELYVSGKELVNAYEEENSPFAQRRKFELQQRDRDDMGDTEAVAVDEGYLASMEWGLPPTGGWGMGIDRLVMMLTGTEKIAEVLTFGGIKSVVSQE